MGCLLNLYFPNRDTKGCLPGTATEKKSWCDLASSWWKSLHGKQHSTLHLSSRSWFIPLSRLHELLTLHCWKKSERLFLRQNGLITINQNRIKLWYSDLYDWNSANFLKVLYRAPLWMAISINMAQTKKKEKKKSLVSLIRQLANSTEGKTSKNICL